jgi:hypothetical protein
MIMQIKSQEEGIQMRVLNKLTTIVMICGYIWLFICDFGAPINWPVQLGQAIVAGIKQHVEEVRKEERDNWSLEEYEGIAQNKNWPNSPYVVQPFSNNITTLPNYPGIPATNLNPLSCDSPLSSNEILNSLIVSGITPSIYGFNNSTYGSPFTLNANSNNSGYHSSIIGSSGTSYGIQPNNGMNGSNFGWNK